VLAFAADPGAFPALGGEDVGVAGVGVAPVQVGVQGAGGRRVVGVVGAGDEEGADRAELGGGTATPTHPGASARPTAAPAPVRIAGAIAVPADGANVPQCAYFSGTATIPAGQTLILVMQNISNGSTDQFVQYVFGWENPPLSPWSWRGAQYFGAVDDSIGQRYRVTLRAVDLDDAHRLGDGDSRLAVLGRALSSVELTRIGGLGSPDGCPGS
jgi:hypothetical protein